MSEETVTITVDRVWYPFFRRWKPGQRLWSLWPFAYTFTVRYADRSSETEYCITREEAWFRAWEWASKHFVCRVDVDGVYSVMMDHLWRHPSRHKRGVLIDNAPRGEETT